MILSRRFAILLVCAACTSSEGEQAPTGGSGAPPQLMVSEPVRGAVVAEGESVMVRGRVEPDGQGPAPVFVQGQPVDVASDGSFEFQLPVSPGLTLLEVTARGANGSEAADRRAVMTVANGEQGASIDDAMVAQIHAGFLDDVSTAVERVLDDGGFSAALVERTIIDKIDDFPVGARVDLDDVRMEYLDLAIVPTEGGIQVSAELRDIRSELRVHLFPIPGASAHLGSFDSDRAYISVELGLELSDGAVQLELRDLRTEFVGGLVDLEDVPKAVREQLVGKVDDEIGDALAEVIADQIRDTINPMLQRLDAVTLSTETLGVRAEIGFAPTALSFDADGGRIAASVFLRFPDDSEIPVRYTTRVVPTSLPVGPSSGLQLSVASDVVNQYLTVLWSAGALNHDAEVWGTLADYLNLDRLEFRPLLPPEAQVAIGGGFARLNVGDLLVRVIDKADNVVAQLAVSGSVSLAPTLGEDGMLELVTIKPEMWVSMMSGDGTSTLSTQVPSDLSLAVMTHLEPLLNRSLEALPQLDLENLGVRSPAIQAATGYLLLSADFNGPDAEDESEPPGPWKTPEEDVAGDESPGAGCHAGGGHGAPWSAGAVLFVLLAYTARRRSPHRCGKSQEYQRSRPGL